MTGGKIESDANMSNQRINLHVPTLEIFALSHNPTHLCEYILGKFVKCIFMLSINDVYSAVKNSTDVNVYLCGISYNLELWQFL